MPRRRGDARSSERGASVVEFVLVMVVLLPLFLGVLQLGLFLHVRNTLVACAHEGARQAANYDGTAAEGVAVTQNCIAGALSPNLARGVSASMTSVSGQPVVAMRVRARMPALGLWGPSFAFTVSGHAVKEPTP
ncbi:TadE/TadG family type IV pilus assembly protein [Thermasporomyces composti]|jgi:Flp pilus assembly protein TadG|uniref:TadE-like protein n=1 Tax=Thermasporomyces composti TaxID=696763 RepID=A0A3D9V7Y3_THECX|nr:TadE/TadG family type IV pilus assembly protein [Thermasporomyces composti]REF37579.1 TadE-like protein [Thermasporomyces composti]